MHKKRLFVSLLLGAFFGFICAYAATIRKPIEITELILISAFYNRILIGFFIGMLDNLKIVNSIYLNSGIRGAFIGFLLSAALSIPWGFDATIGFSAFGAIYGLLIDILSTRISG